MPSYESQRFMLSELSLGTGVKIPRGPLPVDSTELLLNKYLAAY